MQLRRNAYRPGESVRIRWPGEELRGIGYSMDAYTDGEWTVAYYLTARTSGYRGEPSWWAVGAGRRGWVDIGISGLGPDVVAVPGVAKAGTYRLCTANSRKMSCALLEVRE